MKHKSLKQTSEKGKSLPLGMIIEKHHWAISEGWALQQTVKGEHDFK